MASFAVVSMVRRLTGVRRVGHAGTLDPIADGVLPICLGRATRVVEHIVDAPKAYRGTLLLGVTTDSYDSEGAVTATADPSGVTRARVEAELACFVGEIQQLPPMYSALKHEGQPLYRYARAGKTVHREPRSVSIYRMELIRFDPHEVEVRMDCGRGAYVRTVAHDLGQQLGCGAHLIKLTRLRSGPFLLEDAIELEELQAAVQNGRWEELLSPIDRVLESWDAVLLGQQHTLEVRCGRSLLLEATRLQAPDPALDARCRAYSVSGEFLGILRYRGGSRWKPERVFAPL